MPAAVVLSNVRLTQIVYINIFKMLKVLLLILFVKLHRGTRFKILQVYNVYIYIHIYTA
jgi:hypothetical protein